MNDDITNYPLAWPLNQVRTAPGDRKRASFMTRVSSGHGYRISRKHSVSESATALELEIKRMGGDGLIISSNLKVKANGLPHSNLRTPDDPGVAVYFKLQKRDLVFACDRWLSVEDNLRAIVKHIEALRGQERWGVGSLDQAFAGYAALPDPDMLKPWEVLGVAADAKDDEIKRAYYGLAKLHHPDHGGDAGMFDRVRKAFDLMMGKKV